MPSLTLGKTTRAASLGSEPPRDTPGRAAGAVGPRRAPTQAQADDWGRPASRTFIRLAAMSGSVSGGAEGQMRAAARLTRSAPSATLREVSGLVHVDEHSLRRCLRQLPRRGRCAELASNTSASRNAAAAIHAHRAVPPPVLRALEPTETEHALTGLVAPGTAMWASRDAYALVKASLRPMIGDGLADVDALTPRAVQARSARHNNAAKAPMSAQNRSCPPLMLTRYGIVGDVSTRVAVAANPNTDTAALVWLARDAASGVRRMTAANPNCHPLAAIRLTGDEDLVVRSVAAEREGWSGDEVAELARGSDWRSLLAAAGHARCPVDVLDRLVDEDAACPTSVRVAAAANPNCRPDTLAGLVEDVNAEVRAAAARNPSCGQRWLRRLWRDRPRRLQAEVATNPTLPIDVITADISEQIFSIDNQVLRAVAQRTDCDSDILARLAEHPDETVRAAASCNPNLRTADINEQDSSWEMRAELASRVDCPQDVLSRLADDSDAAVCQAVAANSNTHMMTLRRMLQQPDPTITDEAALTLSRKFRRRC